MWVTGNSAQETGSFCSAITGYKRLPLWLSFQWSTTFWVDLELYLLCLAFFCDSAANRLPFTNKTKMASAVVKYKKIKLTKTFCFNTSKQILQLTKCTHTHRGYSTWKFKTVASTHVLEKEILLPGPVAIGILWSAHQRWAQQWLWAAAAAEPVSPGTGTEPADVRQGGSTCAQHQPHTRPREDMEMVHALPAVLDPLLLQLGSAWPVLREKEWIVMELQLCYSGYDHWALLSDQDIHAFYRQTCTLS